MKRAAIFLALFALTLFRYWPPYDPASTMPQGPESWRLAHSLYADGTFSNPFAPMPTGPSAHLAPGYPAYLALLMRLFGLGPAGVFAYQLSAAVAASIVVALLPFAAAELGMGALTGVLAAALWLAVKVQLFPSWEATYAGLLILIATCAFHRCIRHDTRLRNLVTLGLSIGALLLVAPACLPVLACWSVWLLVEHRGRLFRGRMLLLALIPAAMVVPWLIRDYHVFGRFIPIRDNFGTELAISNNDCAAFGNALNLERGCFARTHPYFSAAEAGRALSLGEAEYNRVRQREAAQWIATHRGRFVRLTAQRFVAFWAPHPTESIVADFFSRGRRGERYAIYGLTLVSILGLLVTARRDPAAAAIGALWLAVFPMIYYIVEYEDRYRYPLLWLTFLLGCAPIAEAMRKMWARRSRRA